MNRLFLLLLCSLCLSCSSAWDNHLRQVPARYVVHRSEADSVWQRAYRFITDIRELADSSEQLMQTHPAAMFRATTTSGTGPCYFIVTRHPMGDSVAFYVDAEPSSSNSMYDRTALRCAGSLMWYMMTGETKDDWEAADYPHYDYW